MKKDAADKMAVLLLISVPSLVFLLIKFPSMQPFLEHFGSYSASLASHHSQNMTVCSQGGGERCCRWGTKEDILKAFKREEHQRIYINIRVHSQQTRQLCTLGMYLGQGWVWNSAFRSCQAGFPRKQNMFMGLSTFCGHKKK